MRDRDVVGIFDIDRVTVSKASRDYLTKAQKNGRIITAAEDLPRSFAVCGDKVYLSQFSTATLCGRIKDGEK